MKPILSLAPIGVALSLLLVGCVSGGGGSNATAPPAPDAKITRSGTDAARLPTGLDDTTPAFNAIVADLCQATSPSRTIMVPAGRITFRTPPQPMPCAINLIGEGKGASFLVRAYSGGGFLMWTRGLDQSGGSLQHLQVTTEAGTQGGITVLVSATADPDANSYSLNRHSFLIDDVQIGRLFATPRGTRASTSTARRTPTTPSASRRASGRRTCTRHRSAARGRRRSTSTRRAGPTSAPTATSR